MIIYEILGWLFYGYFYLFLKRIASLFNEKIGENIRKRMG
jgi:hypothetical protein